MKAILRSIFAMCAVGVATESFAQIQENFEPRQGSSISVTDELISQNWLFPDMSINPDGCVPITGTQSLGTGPAFKPDQSSGFVTPYAVFSSDETVLFNYKLHRTFSSMCRRWIVVSLIDEANVATIIDSVELSATTTSSVEYNKRVTGYAGKYAVYVNLKGDGCNSKLIVDDFSLTAPNANINHPAQLLQKPVQGNNGGHNYHGTNLGNVSVFPNPTNANINIHITVNNSGSGVVEMHSYSGELMMRKEALLNEGGNDLQFNMEKYAPGYYFVTINTGNEVITQKFSKVQ